MRVIPVAVLAAFCLQPALKADKFHLSSPEEAKKMAEGSSPHLIEGVLLGEENGFYRLRVVGGELWLAKDLVKSVEKDGLTVADLENREKEGRDRLAVADAERRAAQAAEASARAERRTAAEAALRTEPAPQAVPSVTEPAFDAAVGAVMPPAQMLSDLALQRELELAYELTNDRSYVKLLRKLRRLR